VSSRGTFLAVAIAVVALAESGCRGCLRNKEEPVVERLATESAVLPRVELPENAPALTRTSERTIDVGGLSRSYVLVVPEPLDRTERYPLVLVFHGDGGTAASFHQAFPFERATGADAVLAYPDGIRRSWDLETTSDNRDVLFAEALVRQLAKDLPVDRTRVFATGYSSGGFLANVIACQRSGLLRAIASNAGGAPYNQSESWPNGYPKCPGQTPVAAMALHGRRDFGVTIDSGRFSAEYWAYVNGCDEGRMETTGYDECRAYQGCRSGKSVVFCDVPTLGHWVWDRAAEASWTFFQRH
jgi:polyhydroxybutyrate depolymerase